MGEGDQNVDEMLTVEELCSWFKVSKDWVYDEVEAHRLPYVRLGRRHLRFRRRELEQYLNARSLQPMDQSQRQQ
jgi:excisionase family DNA binding protein